MVRESAASDQIIRSATNLAAYLLAHPREGIELGHLRELLGVIIWKVTEAKGKYQTRYWSEGYRDNPDPAQAIHEHVIERRKLIEWLLAGVLMPENLPSEAIACVVTRDEDVRLRKVGRELNGWERYKAAGIKVWDREVEDWLVLSS
jgi:hypothetical protein